MAIKKSSGDNYLFVLNAFLVIGLIATAAFLREDAAEIKPIVPASQTAVSATTGETGQENTLPATAPTAISAPAPAPATTPTPALTPPPAIVQHRGDDD